MKPFPRRELDADVTVDTSRVTTESAMGATVSAQGTGFRTWAPNAKSVAVVTGSALAAGSNDPSWRPAPEDQLAPLGDGSWGGFLAGIGNGDAYMFFIEGTGSSGWKRDPYARELTSSPAFPDSYCVVRDPGSYPWHDQEWQAPPFGDLIIYQIHVGTWWAQDETGADVRATRGGTFLDVAEKLKHLRNLGVNAIQLLPIQEFETSLSMGYNGVDYFSPEGEYLVATEELGWRLANINRMLASFGKPPLTSPELCEGVDQLKCLVDLCHLHGIAVIFDMVYNHAGGGFDDHSIWFYDRQPTGNNNNSLFFTDQGWAGGEIFAYWNAWVTRFLIDNARFFLTEFRIDGIRYDEVRVIENDGGRLFCQQLTEAVRATNPAAIQIAEYWNPDRASALHPPPQGLGFDAELGDGLRDALRDLLTQASAGASAALDLSKVANALAVPAIIPDGWRLVQCLENQDLTYASHSDAARVAMLADSLDRRSWYARSRSRTATALLFAAPGIPALFMGEEFLEDKNWSDNRRVDGLIWWEGLDDTNPAMRDFLRFTTDLIQLRRSQPALRGNGARVSRVNNFDRVIVLHRWIDGQGEDVVVIANLAEQPKQGYAIGLPFAGGWRELFNSDVYDNFRNPAPIGTVGHVEARSEPLDGFAARAAIAIPANGVIVLGRAVA
jgi:1,4-alpha-glucan branching enzyme